MSGAKLPNCLDTMLCLVGSQSILAPPEKRSLKVAGDASKPPPEGSVRVWKAAFWAGLKSLLFTQSKNRLRLSL